MLILHLSLVACYSISLLISDEVMMTLKRRAAIDLSCFFLVYMPLLQQISTDKMYVQLQIKTILKGYYIHIIKPESKCKTDIVSYNFAICL